MLKTKKKIGQKLFAIRVRAPKQLSLLGGYHYIKARDKEVARRKFRKGFRTQLKITRIKEII